MAADRVDKIELSKRVRAVQEYILMDYTSGDIVNQCMLQWGISEPQARRYMRKAYESWKEITNKDIEELKDYHIQSRMRQIRNLPAEIKNSVAGQRLILEIKKDMAALQGMYVKKFEHSGKDGEALDFSPKLTDNQFQQLLDEARKNKIASD